MAGKEKKPNLAQMPLIFSGFEAAEEIAIKLIRKHHPDLASARIKYICRNKAKKRSGNPVPGHVYKMSPMYSFLTDFDYVVEIALDVWNYFNPHQRNAVIDHLLTRCYGEENEHTGDMRWKIRPPEIQEFTEVAERYGQWHEGLVEMEKCLRKR